jgi:PAS domain S-box-containing protein
MKDEHKTRAQLIDELAELRRRVAELEAAEIEHWRAEKALRESEEMYRALVRVSPDAVTVSDTTTARFIGASQRAVELFGFEDEQEMVGRRVDEVVAPHDLGKAVAGVHRIMKQGIDDNLEYTLVRRDGTRFIGEVSGAIVRDDLGEPKVVIGITRDITARKQAEAALRKSEERYRTLFESAPEGIIVTGPDGKVLSANPAAAAVFGYESAQDMVGVPVTEFYRDPEQRQALFEELMEKGYVKDCSLLPFKNKDGELVYLRGSATLHRDQAGNILRIESIVVDITRQVLAEEALRRRNRDLELLNWAGQMFNSTLEPDRMLAAALEEVRSLLNVTACSVWLIDTQDSPGQLVCQWPVGPGKRIASGWQMTLDVGLAGWVAQHGKPLNAPDTRLDARHFKEIDRLTGVELRSILTVPLRARQKEIGVLQLGDTAVGRFGADDLALVESLAATAAIAIENGRLYEQARQDAATKATLLREVNHRVKNNLSAIIGLLHAEQQHLEKKRADQKSIFQDLSSRIQGLAMVHTMLSDAGWAPLPLNELVGQIIQMALQVLPRHKHVSIDVTPSPVLVTPRQLNDLALIINELTTNTAKYALRGRDEGCIKVHLALEGGENEKEGDTIFLEFRDDGPGYPKQVLTLESLDVGLYLVHKLVSHNLRGQLTLRNDGGAVAAIRFKSQQARGDDQ